MRPQEKGLDVESLSNETLPEEMQERIRALLSGTQKCTGVETGVLETLPCSNIEDPLIRGAELVLETNLLRGSISSLNKIPNEILSKLFLYCCPPDVPIVIPPTEITVHWTLGHVCSRWRKVLWATPHVWAQFRMRDNIPDSEMSAAANFFSRLLLRTTGSVDLVAPASDIIFTTIVVPFASRLRRLNTSASDFAMRSFLELPAGSLDALESIHISVSETGSDFQGKTSVLSTARSLQEVVLEFNNETACPGHLLSLPWSQLTKFILSDSSIPILTIYSILKQCECLAECVLAIDHEDPVSYPDEVIVPNLRSLTLHCGAINWGATLRPLVLPALIQFSAPKAATWDQSAFVALVVRSECRLETLYIGYYFRNFYEVGPLLKALPDLVRLSTPWLVLQV